MKTTWVFLGAWVFTTTAFADSRAGVDEGLIVHEWGTFTTVSGSDGTLLPGLEREEHALPNFVYSHAGFSPANKGWNRPVLGVTVKMETPVIYFYTPKPLNVSVGVTFRGGSISQWYPERFEGEKVSPAPRLPTPVGSLESRIYPALDFAKGYTGSASWNVQILGPDASDSISTRAELETPQWPRARVAGANKVRGEKGEVEGFIFYRGIGNFALPLRVTARADGGLILENNGVDRIPFFYVYDNRLEREGDAPSSPVSHRTTRPARNVQSATMEGLSLNPDRWRAPVPRGRDRGLTASNSEEVPAFLFRARPRGPEGEAVSQHRVEAASCRLPYWKSGGTPLPPFFIHAIRGCETTSGPGSSSDPSDVVRQSLGSRPSTKGEPGAGWHGPLDAGERRELELEPASAGVAAANSCRRLLAAALIESGLTCDEAEALLSTWRESYFDRPGLRVFWIVPRAFTDRVLPLSISPRQRQLERVLVGRTDVLTPEFEAQLSRDFLADGGRRWEADRYALAYRERVRQLRVVSTDQHP